MAGEAHTPGPWVIRPSRRSSNRCIYSAESAYGIGEAWDLSGKAENEANARLMAAAPDLLAQLRFAVKLLLPLAGGTAQLEAMEAAIAKATGADQ